MLIAIDAGGTSTRAVVLDETGRCFGYARAGSGNPTASGVVDAATAVARAAELALDGLEVAGPVAVRLAMAGEQSPAYVAEVTGRLAQLGVDRVDLDHDLLAIFCSGTPLTGGYALIAGTGTVAASVRDGRLDRVVGGRGWLLGDAGSGFWIGRRVARAVVAALDGLGPPTALTGLVLEALGLPADSTIRPVASALFARRTVQMAEFAPLAFRLPEDPVAQAILRSACGALSELVAAVADPAVGGPVVGGGSVLLRGVLASPALSEQLIMPDDAPLIPVPDGVLGSCVMALRGAGVVVDEPRFATLQQEVARVVSAA